MREPAGDLAVAIDLERFSGDDTSAKYIVRPCVVLPLRRA
jgi:hypothetical protein